MCRKWTAGPLLVVDCGTTMKVENPANLGVYRSSEWAERCFCKQCGTPLFYQLIEKSSCFVSAEAFDDRAGYALTRSEERRVGKECVSTCRYRWSPKH